MSRFVGFITFLGSGSAYVFDGLIAVLCCLAEPDKDATCFGVNVGHGIHLAPLLVGILLVDADGIDPEDSLEEAISKMQQGRVQVRCHLHVAFVDGDGSAGALVAPDVREGFVQIGPLAGIAQLVVDELTFNAGVLPLVRHKTKQANLAGLQQRGISIPTLGVFTSAPIPGGPGMEGGSYLKRARSVDGLIACCFHAARHRRILAWGHDCISQLPRVG